MAAGSEINQEPVPNVVVNPTVNTARPIIVFPNWTNLPVRVPFPIAGAVPELVQAGVYATHDPPQIKPSDCVESAIRTVAFAPTAFRTSVSAAVAAIRSPFASAIVCEIECSAMNCVNP